MWNLKGGAGAAIRNAAVSAGGPDFRFVRSVRVRRIGVEMMNKKYPILLIILVFFGSVWTNTASGQSLKRKSQYYIISTKPPFRRVLNRNIELSDANGHLIAEQMFTYLDFKIKGKIYPIFWKSRTTPAPVGLFDNVKYKFLLRLNPQSLKGEVVRIWEGRKLIWTKM
jgi:hypothetical protein